MARGILGWIVAGAALLATLVLAALLVARRPSPGAAVYAVVTPAPGSYVASSVNTAIPVAVSPDGSRLVYCARVGEGPTMLWVRSTGANDARALPGTEEAEQPFFSPDGRSVGFFGRGKLRRADLDGGPVVTLASAGDGRGGSWNRSGTILFTPAPEAPLFAVPAEGGPVTNVTVFDTTLGEATHRYPCFLPDGEHFLYLARTSGAGSGPQPTVWVGRLGSRERKAVLQVASNVVYASGHLLYVRDGRLMAQPFDPRRLATTGPAVQVVPDIQWDERFSRAVFAASQNGVLLCMTGQAQTLSRLRWMDRAGRTIADIGEPAEFTYGGIPALSHDGTMAAMAVLNRDRGTSSIWLVDLATGRSRRVTTCAHDHPVAGFMAGNRALALIQYPQGITRLALSGAGDEQDLVRWPEGIWLNDCSRDGRYLSFNTSGNGRSEQYVVDLSGGDPGMPVRLRSDALDGAFSPDGRWIAYTSIESGREEVYVAAFPATGARWQVSTAGGREPRWNPRGGELFYFDLQNHLIAVEARATAEGFEAGVSRPLFQYRYSVLNRRYDVGPDGNRFLVSAQLDDPRASQLTLLTDWTRRVAGR